MARFDRAIATAERLINRNGQLVQWRSYADGAPPDTSKPWKPGQGGETNTDVVICFLPQDKESRELFRYLRGTNDVPTGFLQGLMKGNISFVPALSDVVVRDGEIMRIRSIELLSPNGQKVLYTVELET